MALQAQTTEQQGRQPPGCPLQSLPAEGPGVCVPQGPRVRTGPCSGLGEGRTVTWGLGEEPSTGREGQRAGSPMGGLHGRDSLTASWTSSTQGSELQDEDWASPPPPPSSVGDRGCVPTPLHPQTGDGRPSRPCGWHSRLRRVVGAPATSLALGQRQALHEASRPEGRPWRPQTHTWLPQETWALPVKHGPTRTAPPHPGAPDRGG